MNFNLYIFGTPNGYNQYPSDSNSQLIQSFYQKQKTDSQLVIHRAGQLIYYTYIRKLGSHNTYFGISLIFNGVYCSTGKEFFDLFDKAFSDIALKGQILKIDGSGKIFFSVNQFVNEVAEIDRIKTFFQKNIETGFSGNFIALTSSDKVGNGEKILSIKDQNKDIVAAIRQYDYVFICNNEKPHSELDRIHKMLSELYSEKQYLNTQYGKLQGQKKQYKVVMFLCIAIAGCILGLIVFNKNLQSKESKLKFLETELIEKKEIISSQLSNIAQLQIIQSGKNDTILIQRSKIAKFQIAQLQLSNEINNLKETIDEKIVIANQHTEEIDNLINKISNFTLETNSLRRDLGNVTNQNRRLSSEISSLRNSSVQQYKVVVSKSYCYRKCAATYSNNDCFYSLGAILDVYTQQDGYGLTIGGYLKMSDLQKY